ncbi:MAG: chlorohydrolase [Devosia sp.]|uniref:guanine deaminase n=1 Tax=Devosia sp. TaxID=1871048 RepID=UPI00263337B4|nr:guanine deaminase [Devosia sp.]MDB5585349.1 chlorohydrolase [Devosia sp.]
MDVRGRAILGTFFHAPTPVALEVLSDVLIEVDAGGVITSVLRPTDPAYARAVADLGEAIIRLPAGHYGVPGFVDLHVHAPQYPQLGLALDEPLEIWLQKYTFPLEARYADLDFARERYQVLVDDLIAGGTTTALYFATQDREASKLLADICIAKGQRALVGKVVMDDPAACPDDYRDASAAAAVADTREVIDYIRNQKDNADARVLPVITPRFIPSCTDEALAGLGQLAAECGCHVQTHCSESDWAHGHALTRYGVTDAEALDGFGLLTRKSVLAHANFLTEPDMDRLVARGTAVAHCALSNIYFANAVFPLRLALEKHLHVGLGTDISGGPSASMFEACRSTVQASRLLEDGVDPALPAAARGRPRSRIDLVTAFYLATTGGGIALDLPIGVLAPGYRFDAILIDSTARGGNIRLFDMNEPAAIFEKILYGASRANIARVWVDGRQLR